MRLTMKRVLAYVRWSDGKGTQFDEVDGVWSVLAGDGIGRVYSGPAVEAAVESLDARGLLKRVEGVPGHRNRWEVVPKFTAPFGELCRQGRVTLLPAKAGDAVCNPEEP